MNQKITFKCILLFIFLGIYLLFFSNAVCAATKDENHQSVIQVNKRLENYLKENNINGLILINNEYSDGFKVIKNNNIHNKRYQVKENQYFPIASLQKIITGALIYDLVKEKKLNWNTNLSRFYPNVKNSNKIKIWQLMSHQSGVFDKEKIPKLPLSDETSRMNYVMKSFEVKDRQKWNYASSNFGILASIIHKKNNTYDNSLKGKILSPYKINEIKSPEELHYNQVVLPLTLYSKKMELVRKIIYMYSLELLFKGINNEVIPDSFSWLILKDCLSPAFGAGDKLATPRAYWKLVTNLLLNNPKMLKTFQRKAKKTEKGYFGGCYFRKHFCYASGNIGDYNCCCFAADLKDKKMIMFFTNNMNYLSLKKTQKYLYSTYFGENIYS
ncbi:serine hydrolase domain-containing protein [uncultured Lactobacillus sp.]|jgi:hypothetical protein|uniref:serine hydrolase n=1 Tax=uncultured Lactobacillus sp. TaxID=153152 RepID=UPI00258FBC54|nr:serine hydrolase domain-containing protein [uncultured Lactobacillus sp.]